MSLSDERYIDAVNMACEAHLSRVKAAFFNRAAAVLAAKKQHRDFHADTRAAYAAALLAAGREYSETLRASERRRTQEDDKALRRTVRPGRFSDLSANTLRLATVKAILHLTLAGIRVYEFGRLCQHAPTLFSTDGWPPDD